MQRMMCAVYGVGRVWGVRGRVCVVYGGAVGVVGGVCSGYDGCSVTVDMVSGVCSVWCVQCMVWAVYTACAEYVVFSVWRRGWCSVRCVQWIRWVQGNGCAGRHMASGVCSVWWVQCRVCAVYTACAEYVVAVNMMGAG